MGVAIEVTPSLIIHESNCQSGDEMKCQANTGTSQTTSTIYYQKSSFSEETRGPTREALSAKPSHHSGRQIWAGNFALLMFGWECVAITNILCTSIVVQHSMGRGCQGLPKCTPRIQRTHERYTVIHPTSPPMGRKPHWVFRPLPQTNLLHQPMIPDTGDHVWKKINAWAHSATVMLDCGMVVIFFFPNCKQHRELQRQQGQKILGWNYRSGNKHKRMSRDFQHVVCRLQGQWRTTMESKLYIWHLQRRPNPWKRKLRPHDPRKGLKPSSSSSRTWMRLFHEVHSSPGFKGTSFNTTDTFTYDSAMGGQYLVHLKKEQAPH